MERDIESFLVYLQETKKMSENTMVSYHRDLNKLMQFLSDRTVYASQDITITHLESYVLYLEQKGFASASISRMVASVKAFFRYLVRQGIVTEDCAQDLRAPKVEKKEKTSATSEELFLLLEQPSDQTSKGIRDRAMMELLYATGINVSDLIALKMADINMKLGCVTCRNKTHSFGRETQMALAKYLSNARMGFMKEADCDLLFVNCSGGRMSRQGFWKLLKGYAREAGIQTDITSYMIRK